jgi:leader peptidase (prepilin peptidase) / N-methyltransferase
MSRYEILNATLHFLAFFMGAGIGSFLNVVIYRLPRGISVNQPRRSFCPSCKKQIPWYRNIPVFSWMALRGKCADCGLPISARYVLVELLVGALFYAVFITFGGPWHLISEWGPLVAVLWIFISLLVSGTFIDLEHYILPHEITIGGTVAGILCALWAPAAVSLDLWQVGETISRWQAVKISFFSALLGLGTLWIIVELGKLAFGRKKFVFEKEEAWSVTQPDENEPPVVTMGGEVYGWADLFSRKSDRLMITAPSLRVNDREFREAVAEMKMETLKVTAGGKNESFDLEQVTRLEGTTTGVVIPREAMGFGDVLFLMMIGAFCSWKCVLFTILAASLIGTVFALVPRLLGRSEWSAKIPFGPYLAAGAAIYVFWGPQLIDWYLGKTGWM